MTPLKLGIHGAAGRLGQRIVALALADARFDLAAALVRPDSSLCGEDAGLYAGAGAAGLAFADDAAELARCDVVIDVTTPDAAIALAQALAESGGPALVTGTTGWSAAQEVALGEAAQAIPLLRAGNFSLGVTALTGQVRALAAQLGRRWGVHIHDLHHSAKKDAPSGTALMLADAVRAGWGHDDAPTRALPVGESLDQPPRAGEILITSAREGDAVGVHQVRFCGPGETLVLGHDAHSRDIFARGALTAAHWLAQQPAGLYTMADVLALTAPGSA